MKSQKIENATCHIYQHFSIDEGIVSFSKKVGADMVVMTTHGRKGLSRFILGSVAEDVANYSQIPVLTQKV